MPTARASAFAGTPLWRTLFGVLSPSGARARLTILILHRVREAPDPIFPGEVDAAAFRQRMEWVREWFHVLPLDDAVARLGRGDLPSRALAITFDDGYADNATVALPILRDLGLHSTFFIATDFLDGGMMWNDAVIEAVRQAPGSSLDGAPLGLGSLPIATPEERKDAIVRILSRLKYLPQAQRQAAVDTVAAITGAKPRRDLMMSSAQVRELAAAGMGIGGHTATHPILARLDDRGARDEIAGGRETLVGLVRQPVRLFAYPNGKPDTDYRQAHVAMVKGLGFAAAVSTAPGAGGAGDSPFELPRFTPWGRTRGRWAMHLARNLRGAVAGATT